MSWELTIRTQRSSFKRLSTGVTKRSGQKNCRRPSQTPASPSLSRRPKSDLMKCTGELPCIRAGNFPYEYERAHARSARVGSLLVSSVDGPATAIPTPSPPRLIPKLTEVGKFSLLLHTSNRLNARQPGPDERQLRVAPRSQPIWPRTVR